ncbi:hypothetical protein HA402_013698 [Bradysia odoriphaga]|nr:hypothetical protein HA402_013698 [Bradysia odoriphaga]
MINRPGGDFKSLNRNDFSPVSGEGDNGKPVIVPAKDVLKMQQKFQINRFNLMASDRMPLNRTLPDVRKKLCIQKLYPPDLPRTSIIIVFHNEAWSVLMRTVWSVINRSPKYLLEEILLVDDASDREFLKHSLDDYVAKLPVKTVVLRQNRREGLVAARLLGAKHANGEVLTFLDAHCECSIGWLQPLLASIKENRRSVPCPVIDIISDNNFGYIKSFELHWGAFNWQLHFRWYLLGANELNKRKTDVIAPFPTPAMAGKIDKFFQCHRPFHTVNSLAGGLFSIEKAYFYEIGSYDERMKIWGGDNLEMSFRIWQCGGRIEIVPCSHVGHLFRKSSPYTFPGGISNVLNENLVRTAKVWMDDWAQFFYQFTNDVTQRQLLRKSLKCQNFEWYLTNIWQDHFFPTNDRFFGKIMLIDTSSEQHYEYLNRMRNFDLSRFHDWSYAIDYFNRRTSEFSQIFKARNGLCIQKPNSQDATSVPYGQAKLSVCGNATHVEDFFVVTNEGQIMTNEGVCVDAVEKGATETNSSMVRIVTCAESKRQKWLYNVKTQQIVQGTSNFCLTADQSVEKHLDNFPRLTNESFNVTLSVCNESKLQKWILLPFKWKA